MQPDSGRSESEHQSQNMTELSAGVWVEEVEATFSKKTRFIAFHLCVVDSLCVSIDYPSSLTFKLEESPVLTRFLDGLKTAFSQGFVRFQPSGQVNMDQGQNGNLVSDETQIKLINLNLSTFTPT